MDKAVPQHASVNFEALGKDLPRKTVCFLVVDLVNSTFFKSDNDSATWQAGFRLGFSIIAETAEAHHGRIIKFLGDGFLIVFDHEGGDDKEEDCVRAAIAIQKDLETARKGNQLSQKFQVRISLADARAYKVEQTHITPSGERVTVAIDYLGPEVDLVFRLNGAISAHGIIANRRLVDNVRWGRLADELALESAQGEMKRFLGKINLKGLGAEEAHEIAWGGQFFGLKGSQPVEGKDPDPAKPRVDAGMAPPRPSGISSGSNTAYVHGGTTVLQTRMGHVYSLTVSGVNFWIEEHGDDRAQHIGVAPNVVRRDVPDLMEVVLFVRRNGSPHPKAVQILRSGTTFTGTVRSVQDGIARVKIEEYAANAHDPLECTATPGLKSGDKVTFTLMIEAGANSTFFASGVDLKLVL
jgi:class 3 adenylate cyclase